MKLRFGINMPEGREKTQKEVADLLGISQSYISRLEKRMLRLCGLPPMPEWREALAEFLKSGL